VTAILDEANATNCDLVAISTHGRGGLPRLLFGSVADKVIRSAHQAVLVCRGAQ
jgi:nucleotide-binding universal stress UspA family protein